MKLTLDQENQIINLYKNGHSGLEIAKQFNCSDMTIYAILQRNNIPRRNRSEAAYKGSKFPDKSGYVRVTPMGKDKELNDTNYRFMLEHRLIMARHLGRKLLHHETVHHINGDRSDNRLENLELWNTSQPRGQRVKDKVEWAKQILKQYGYI